MSLCPACDAPVQADWQACTQCGAPLAAGDVAVEESEPTCPGCGAENEPGNRFCTQCGTRIEEKAEEAPARGRATRRLDMPPDWEKAQVTHLLPDHPRSHAFEDKFTIGRDRGDLVVDGDPFLSTRHAMIRREKGQFLLQDLGSRNGTFIHIRGEAELLPGDEMMMGSQIFRVRIERDSDDREEEEEEGGFRTQRLAAPSHSGPILERVVKGRRVDEVFPLTKEKTIIGRDEGDICFPDDGLLSGVHASVVRREAEHGSTHVVRDEGSRNGVFLRVRDLWPLQEGDVFTAGRQVFRFEGGKGEGGAEAHGGGGTA